jgi:hypothetical protein
VCDQFCSLGTPKVNFKLPFKIRHVNLKRIQSTSSNFCGLYCIYFLVGRSQGFSLEQIVKRFGPSPRLNDLLVVKYYNKVRNFKVIDRAQYNLLRCCSRFSIK